MTLSSVETVVKTKMEYYISKWGFRVNVSSLQILGA